MGTERTFLHAELVGVINSGDGYRLELKAEDGRIYTKIQGHHGRFDIILGHFGCERWEDLPKCVGNGRKVQLVFEAGQKNPRYINRIVDGQVKFIPMLPLAPPPVAVSPLVDIGNRYWSEGSTLSPLAILDVVLHLVSLLSPADKERLTKGLQARKDA